MKAALEARNGLLQFDAVEQLVDEMDGVLRLTPEIICRLQGIATRDILSCAGTFRLHEEEISNTPHRPPPPDQVPGLVQEMCEYANSHGKEQIHVASYLLWRLNWIHPFRDGNGRTSRAVSYLALCVGYGMWLPGVSTVPDFISREKSPYYAALDEADAAWKENRLDVSAMERMMTVMLQWQLSLST